MKTSLKVLRDAWNSYHKQEENPDRGWKPRTGGYDTVVSCLYKQEENPDRGWKLFSFNIKYFRFQKNK